MVTYQTLGMKSSNVPMPFKYSACKQIHCVSEKLDPLLFYHMFNLTATNFMKIFRRT